MSEAVVTYDHSRAGRCFCSTLPLTYLDPGLLVEFYNKDIDKQLAFQKQECFQAHSALPLGTGRGMLDGLPNAFCLGSHHKNKNMAALAFSFFTEQRQDSTRRFISGPLWVTDSYWILLVRICYRALAHSSNERLCHHGLSGPST